MSAPRWRFSPCRRSSPPARARRASAAATTYLVRWTSVDGAGTLSRRENYQDVYVEFATIDAAIAEADRLAASANADGNDWGYVYTVAPYYRGCRIGLRAYRASFVSSTGVIEPATRYAA